MSAAQAIGAAMLLVACTPPATPSPASPIAVREIGFATVADAHAALANRPDVQHVTRDAYEVFVDDPARAVWVFTLPGSAAYPALVRRQLVDTQAGIVMRSAVFCEAAGAACALLRENTQLIDAAILGQLGRPDAPPPQPASNPPAPGVRI